MSQENVELVPRRVEAFSSASCVRGHARCVEERLAVVALVIGSPYAAVLGSMPSSPGRLQSAVASTGQPTS